MIFYVITKNLNWEILTRIWLLSKNGMGLRMKNFNIMGVLRKTWFLGGVHEKPIYGGIAKKGDLDSLQILLGDLAKKRRVDTQIQTLNKILLKKSSWNNRRICFECKFKANLVFLANTLTPGQVYTT